MPKRLFITLTLLAVTLLPTTATPTDSLLNSLYTEARALLTKQQYMQARPLYEQLLALDELPRTTRVNLLNEVGSCYKQLGEYALARKSLEEALSLARTRHKDPIRINLSNLYLISGSYPEAIAMLQQVTGKAWQTTRMLNLSHAYFRRGEKGDNKQALLLTDSCLNLTKENKDIQTQAIALQNRGYIWWDRAEWEEAEADLSQAIALLATNDMQYHITTGNLAIVKAELGKYTEALQLIERTVNWMEKQAGKQAPDYIIALRKRAEILLMMNRTTEAVQAFKLFFQAEKQQVTNTFPTLSEQRRLDYWHTQKPLVSQIFRLKGADAPFLYDVALFRRHIALLPQVTPQQLKKRLDINCQAVKKALKPNEAALEFICYPGKAEKDTLYAVLLLTHQQGVKFIPLTTRKSLHRFMINPSLTLEQAVCSTQSQDKNEIYTHLPFAEFIWNPILQQLPSAINTLYFAPDGIMQMLGIEQLPHPQLNRLHLHRLTSTANLVERGKSHPSPNGKSLVVGGVVYDQVIPSQANGKQPNHEAYDFLTQQLGKKTTTTLFDYLYGTASEADSIRHKLSVQPPTDKQHTTEEFLKREMGNYQTIHLATHGYSLKVTLAKPSYLLRDSLMEDKTLLASGIALAGANVAANHAQAEDGLLSAREMCKLNLSAVDLIVISACQAAQGWVSDEGPAGVVRGLKKAGAKNIIATLWPVDDNATRLFMNHFYDAWKRQGVTKHQAMNLARKALRKHTVKQRERFSIDNLRKQRAGNTPPTKETRPYEKPYYWAAFILLE